MTARDFCFWLQGMFELTNPTSLTPEQTDKVKSHLALVFRHEIDPSMGNAAQQEVLDALHDRPVPSSGPSHGVKYRC